MLVQELASALQSAQPKIQKMCEEDSDDSEAVAKLLEINDSIHRTIERYKLIKKGDLDAASKIPKGTLGTSTGVSKTADNELSLIDFSGDVEHNSGTSGNMDGSMDQTVASVEDDLLGLSMQDQNYGQEGGIALGFGANASKFTFLGLLNWMKSHTTCTDVPGPSLLSSSTQQSTAKIQTPSATPQAQQAPLPARPNYDPFSSITGSHNNSRSTTPGPSSLSQSQQGPKPLQASLDSFSTLSSPAPLHASPSPIPQNSHAPPSAPSASIFDFATPKAPGQSAPAPVSHLETNGALAEEDWNFSSALPEDSNLPISNDITVSNTSVNIAFRTSRIDNSDSVISIMAHFSNNVASLITEYTFQVAVTKVRLFPHILATF